MNELKERNIREQLKKAYEEITNGKKSPNDIRESFGLSHLNEELYCSKLIKKV